MWKIVDYDLPDCLMWAWLPEEKERILAFSVDNVVIDLESGDEVYASHYIVIEEPPNSPIIH